VSDTATTDMVEYGSEAVGEQHEQRLRKELRFCRDDTLKERKDDKRLLKAAATIAR
jgi:hypothetical protein